MSDPIPYVAQSQSMYLVESGRVTGHISMGGQILLIPVGRSGKTVAFEMHNQFGPWPVHKRTHDPLDNVPAGFGTPTNCGGWAANWSWEMSACCRSHARTVRALASWWIGPLVWQCAVRIARSAMAISVFMSRKAVSEVKLTPAQRKALVALMMMQKSVHRRGSGVAHWPRGRAGIIRGRAIRSRR